MKQTFLFREKPFELLDPSFTNSISFFTDRERSWKKLFAYWGCDSVFN
ncbi:hypothetical protein LEP1GSC121_3028 [Leptospira borgpetersenii serovar Castellonis str. 200801910]|uniref:Uncharacterized protein n=1 Tax=Leptospira borgpetersenii serovar Ballum TaxID=280505 RepID=A0A0S2IQI7_LEPBO|nr:hypothetical protein LBBP_01255 [Leptospira borgpetersenii serovar Ballum]EKQ98486.1 hypothetical protein LEP1GSC121_3028 [Leptospira borgpetersenii serovar Castellonis str. 200801910]EMK08253.1 hypothetical protein LEP1GSC066_0039 [Leptospira sp. serovar Kenya str. Sh9]